MPESTSSDLNAVANSKGPDETIKTELSGQLQDCLPSYTGSLTLLNCNQTLIPVVVVGFNGPLRKYFSRNRKREIMGDDGRNNPNPHLLQAQCPLQLSKTVGRPALKVTKRAPLPDLTTYKPGKEKSERNGPIF